MLNYIQNLLQPLWTEATFWCKLVYIYLNIESIDLILIVILTTFHSHTSLGLLQIFQIERVTNIESRTEPIIWSSGANCSNSVIHDQIRRLSYNRYSVLFLLIAGIEPTTSRWFHSEGLSNQTPYLRCICVIFYENKSIFIVLFSNI